MIEPVPSTAAQKFVIGQESNRLKESRTKRGNSNVPRFQYQVTVLFHLTLCQSSEHFQNILLTKLFRASLLSYIRHYCFLFFNILKNWGLTSPLKAFMWKKSMGSRNLKSAQIPKHIYIYLSIYNII